MEDRQLSITITTGTIIKTVVVLALAWLLVTLRSIVLIVLTAIVIASAVEPGVTGLVKRKIPRTIAVVIVYFVVFIIFFGLFYFFIPPLIGDLSSFLNALPRYLSVFTENGAFGSYASIFGVAAPQSISPSDILNEIANALSLPSAQNVWDMIAAIFGGVFSFILIVVFSIYFAIIETGVDDFLRVVTPPKYESYMLGLWRRAQHKIGLWMQGQLLLAVMIGVLVYLGLTIIGVPHALVLAVIAGCFEIIPVFGPVLAAIPAIAVAFGSGGLTLGITTILLYIIAQQFENHLIYPLVVTRVVGVPPLLVIIALISGGELFGFLGIILSVPTAAIIQELAHDYQAGKLKLGQG